MITIYLCDDNEILLQKYQKKISEYAAANQLQLSMRTFTSGEQLLFYMEDKTSEPDIIYLDILMGELNGIETAKKLRNYGYQAGIIFLTSSEEYVFESFDVDPLHYILKDDPNVGKFEEVLTRAISVVSKKKKDVLICTSGSVTKQIPIHTISHFEVRNRIVTVYFDRTSFDFYSTIEKLEQDLIGKGFVRCHRAFVVSLKHIDEISKESVKTIEGNIVPIGPSYLKKLKLEFSDSLANF